METVDLYGKEMILFKLSLYPLNQIGPIIYTSSNDEMEECFAYIDESRYKLSENYKITLKPFNKQFETKHFYINDLESLIHKKEIKMFIKEEINNLK